MRQKAKFHFFEKKAYMCVLGDNLGGGKPLKPNVKNINIVNITKIVKFFMTHARKKLSFTEYQDMY